MYKRVINLYKENNNEELDIILDLNSKQNRMKLASSNDKQIRLMFEEGYNQMREYIQNGQITKKLQ